MLQEGRATEGVLAAREQYVGRALAAKAVTTTARKRGLDILEEWLVDADARAA